MARHSKWHNIKHRKAAADAKRGKIFTRHAKLISIAARSGGGDPDMNPLLRAAIENAKAANLPNDNIERAVKKGIGDGKSNSNFEEIVYDAYGPGGVAMQIQVLTDNRNRAITNIKHILNKKGGRFVDAGSLAWMFKKVGEIDIKKPLKDPEELALELIDAGAEDWEADQESMKIWSSFEGFSSLLSKLKNDGLEIINAEIILKSDNQKEVENEEDFNSLMNLIDFLEEDEDVDAVYTDLA